MENQPDLKLIRPTWVEIDLDVIASNVRAVRRMIGPDVYFFAVVKADAYGHGIVAVAQTCLDEGANGVAVGNPLDAIRLRNHGVQCPILLYASTLPSEASSIILDYGLIPTVLDLETAKAYAEVGRGSSVDVFVKIDTGFNRLGVPFYEAVPFLVSICQMSGLSVRGIYTHLSDPMAPDYVNLQHIRFTEIVQQLREQSINVPTIMLAASAVIPDHPELYLTAVNPGHMLYGLSPRDSDTSPAFRAFKTKVIQVKRISPGQPVGYLRCFTTNRLTTIGILPVGYADGYPKCMGNRGYVLVRGQKVPVIADVALEYTIVDLTDVPDAQVGDEVVLIGQQGDNSVTLAELSKLTGLTPLQIILGISRYIPMVYIRNGTKWRPSNPLEGETS